jgi:hypothetical protein
MRKTLLAVPLLASAMLLGEEQTAPQQTPPEKPSTQDTAAETPKAGGEATGAEPAFNASVEVGYRWNSDVQGSRDVYRSVVNLGDGPRLLNADFRFVNPTQGGWLDRLNLRASGWGGDPYNSVRLEMRGGSKYRLTVDHRNMAYFNSLPSFANPNLERGILTTQSSYDIFRKFTDTELELRPATRIIPYFGFLHNSASGRGISTFVQNLNEYAVARDLDDNTQNYRAGVRLETLRWHVTLEQGWTRFEDTQRLFTSDRNTGNRTTPFSGQTLFLGTADARYNIDGSGIYSRVLATARPTDWLDLYGNFLFSQPKNDNTYTAQATGNFAQTNPILFTQNLQFAAGSAAKQPHTNGNGGFELRPFRRVRIVESFLTDRFHTAGAINTVTAVPVTGDAPFLDRLELNYNQQQLEVLLDVTRGLTLRAGHKYIWGDSLSRAPSLAQGTATVPRVFETGELKINAIVAGLTYRFTDKFSVFVDAEGASGDKSYFQTSLRDYKRVRFRGQLQARADLMFTGSFAYFDNTNPGPERTYDFESRNTSLGVSWSPKNARHLRVLGEYARTTFWSDTLYIIPDELRFERNFYRENGHSGTTLLELAFGSRAPRLSVGGSLYRSAGSRPSHYYQPLARLAVPIVKHMDWNAEWRWFGFTEPYLPFESFRGHQAIFSVRVY